MIKHIATKQDSLQEQDIRIRHIRYINNRIKGYKPNLSPTLPENGFEATRYEASDEAKADALASRKTM